MAKILIVDDERLVRESLRDILEEKGHDVVEAANGRQAVDTLRKEPSALVVTDIMMPEKEGLETIIAVKRGFPVTPILAISGGGRIRNVDLLNLAKQCGAERILAKPFSVEELMEVVDALLG